MALEPQYSEAVEFLGALRPDGPWHVWAKEPDGRKQASATFFPGDEEKLLEFLEQHGNFKNLYYTANVVARPMDKKPSKTDIAIAEFLYVDIDPKDPPEDLDEHKVREWNKQQREELLRRATKMPDGIPHPSIVVFSGNGYQLLWRLEEPVPIDGEKAKWTEYEAYNRALEAKLGGDNTHNVERLLRLPGTINRPDAKKRKKHREPALACKLAAGNESYQLSAFSKAPPKRYTAPSTTSKGGSASGVIDDLPSNVSDTNKAMIVQGEHPVNTERYKKADGSPDHSATLFAVLIALVSKGVPDEQIVGLVTNRDNGISKHLLSRPNPEQEAARQIDRARAYLDTASAPIKDDDGKFYNSDANIRAMLGEMGVVLAHDEMAQAYEIRSLPGAPDGHYQDEHQRRIRRLLQDRYGLAVSLERVDYIVKEAAFQRRYHPIREYLGGLSWDGRPRVERMLPDLFGAADTELNRETGKLLMIAAVKRIYQPGCKYDTLVVFEGAQGIGKSSGVRALCPHPDWFSDSFDEKATDPKSLAENGQGVWIWEIPEFQAIKNHRALKDMLSRAADRARVAYAKNAANRLRQSVFVATTNDENYLADDTGNRRYIGVSLAGEVDVDAIRRDRDQLWAEAVHLAADHGDDDLALPRRLWSEAAAQIAEREALDPTTDRLSRLLPETGIVFLDDAVEAADLPQTKANGRTVGASLRKLGFENKAVRVPGRVKPERHWIRGDNKIEHRLRVDEYTRQKTFEVSFDPGAPSIPEEPGY